MDSAAMTMFSAARTASISQSRISSSLGKLMGAPMLFTWRLNRRNHLLKSERMIYTQGAEAMKGWSSHHLATFFLSSGSLTSMIENLDIFPPLGARRAAEVMTALSSSVTESGMKLLQDVLSSMIFTVSLIYSAMMPPFLSGCAAADACSFRADGR